MITVLDASAALEVILSRKHSDVLKQNLLNARKVISSDLYKAETANALWKYVKAGMLGVEQANELLRLALELVDEYIDISENSQEAMNESIRLNHPVYDMLYLTAARRHSAILLTLDKRLADLAVKEGITTNVIQP